MNSDRACSHASAFVHCANPMKGKTWLHLSLICDSLGACFSQAQHGGAGTACNRVYCAHTSQSVDKCWGSNGSLKRMRSHCYIPYYEYIVHKCTSSGGAYRGTIAGRSGRWRGRRRRKTRSRCTWLADQLHAEQNGAHAGAQAGGTSEPPAMTRRRVASEFHFQIKLLFLRMHGACILARIPARSAGC